MLKTVYVINGLNVVSMYFNQEGEIKMKLFGWIWSNKKQETETYVIPQWESYTAKTRRYNLDHGLPEDQLVG